MRVQRTGIVVGGGGRRGGWKLLVPTWWWCPLQVPLHWAVVGEGEDRATRLAAQVDVDLQVPKSHSHLHPPSYVPVTLDHLATQSRPTPTTEADESWRRARTRSLIEHGAHEFCGSTLGAWDISKLKTRLPWTRSRSGVAICRFSFSALPLQRIIGNFATDTVIRSRTHHGLPFESLPRVRRQEKARGPRLRLRFRVGNPFPC